MKFLNAPRQPFVGLSLAAAIGITIADVFPLPGAALVPVTIILAICTVIVACRPTLLATYAIVGVGFFLLHNFETNNTEGQRLADELGGRPRVVTAIGSVITEPKVAPRGLESAPEVQNFLSGIVLGLRHQAPEDIEEPFQQTGTLHLFAVAGLHVGIVAALLWMLAMVARLSRKWAAVLIIPLLLFYAAVTGLHVSSVRAAVMGSVLLVGLFFDRMVFVFTILAAAAFVFVAWHATEVFSTGV